MSIGNVFDIAGTAMSAQSLRLNTVASNLANAQSAASSVEEVYRARHPVFAAVHRQALDGMESWNSPPSTDDDVGRGVQVLGIVESNAPLEMRYEPGHPLANDEGYVYYPNVNVVEQMTDMIAASRAFQVNVELLQSAKTMAQRLLSLGQ